MNNNSDKEYGINEMLLRLIQPYGFKAREQLMHDLLAYPEKRTIHIWNGMHLDDVEAHNICKQCGLNMMVQEVDFADISEASVYICKRQLKRSDIASEYRKYLIGQRFFCEQAIRSDAKSADSKYAIASTIASELYISTGTVLKYSVYANAMNTIFDQDIMFAKSILTGKVRISHENTIELSRLKPEEIRSVARSSSEEKIEHITLSYIRNEVKWSHVQLQDHVSRRERREEKEKRKKSIRQMPEYDPDAEVNSLCMTIDSWVSSIKRVNNSENFPKTTYSASLKLVKKLSILEHTINMMQEALEERMGI